MNHARVIVVYKMSGLVTWAAYMSSPMCVAYSFEVREVVSVSF